MAVRSPIAVRFRGGLSLPVLGKELRSRMRGNRAPVILFVATALTIAAGMLVLLLEWRDLSSDSWLANQAMARAGRTLFAVLIIAEGVVCALVTPALTAGTISLEREQQTLDMLMLTRLSSMNILLGKLFSAVSFAMIMLLCGLPVAAVSFLLGGVAPAELAWATAILLGVILLFGTIGVYCSARFQRTAGAVVAAYLACLAWILLLPGFVFAVEILRSALGLYRYFDSHLLEYALLFISAILLVIAACLVISALYAVIARRALPRVAQLAVAGMLIIGLICASNALDVPGAMRHHSDYVIFCFTGNPVVAMLVLFFSRDLGTAFSGIAPPFTWLLHHLSLVTVGIHLVLAWALVTLAAQRLRRARA